MSPPLPPRLRGGQESSKKRKQEREVERSWRGTRRPSGEERASLGCCCPHGWARPGILEPRWAGEVWGEGVLQQVQMEGLGRERMEQETSIPVRVAGGTRPRLKDMCVRVPPHRHPGCLAGSPKKPDGKSRTTPALPCPTPLKAQSTGASPPGHPQAMSPRPCGSPPHAALSLVHTGPAVLSCPPPPPAQSYLEGAPRWAGQPGWAPGVRRPRLCLRRVGSPAG